MARLRFTVEVGVFARGGAKRAIQRYCWERGLVCHIEESKGLLDSVYRFTITGPRHMLIAAQRDLTAWLADPYGA